MDDYISREAVLSKCQQIWSNADETTEIGVAIINIVDELADFVENIPSADVQPVKQWYSVEENQPDSVGDDVLVVDSYGKYHIAYYLSGSENWMNQDTGELIKDVVKWRYLEGDSNE